MSDDTKKVALHLGVNGKSYWGAMILGNTKCAPSRSHKSASHCFLCKRSNLARKQDAPKSWSKWRDDKISLCQMILKKVALPVGVDGKSYWEAMILPITNNKFCSLRANFMQELFE